jgi:hypothetical protein
MGIHPSATAKVLIGRAPSYFIVLNCTQLSNQTAAQGIMVATSMHAQRFRPVVPLVAYCVASMAGHPRMPRES